MHAMCRSGERAELMRGTFYYAFAVATLPGGDSSPDSDGGNGRFLGGRGVLHAAEGARRASRAADGRQSRTSPENPGEEQPRGKSHPPIEKFAD